MEIRAKIILLMAAMCILTTTALSQGGPMAGPNGGPGNAGEMLGPNDGPSGQGVGNDNGQPPIGHRFKGCNTDPRRVASMVPIKPSADKPDEAENKLDPKDAPHNEPAPWEYVKPDDGKHDGPFFGFAGPDGRTPPRSIMGPDHPQVPPKKPKKSMMDKKHHRVHKGPLKPLNPEDLPELPPMKSLMDHGR